MNLPAPIFPIPAKCGKTRVCTPFLHKFLRTKFLGRNFFSSTPNFPCETIGRHSSKIFHIRKNLWRMDVQTCISPHFSLWKKWERGKCEDRVQTCPHIFHKSFSGQSRVENVGSGEIAYRLQLKKPAPSAACLPRRWPAPKP